MKNIVFTFLFRSPDQETCPATSLIHRISEESICYVLAQQEKGEA